MLPTKEQIQKKFEGAPEYVQDFITSEELQEIFTNLRKKYSLQLDEAGQVSVAINAIALELAPLDSFPSLMKEAVPGMDSMKRSILIKDINESVFEELREWARLDKEGLLYEDEETDKLKTETYVAPQKVDTSLDVEPVTQSAPDKKYPGSDPYREPIE